MAAPLVLLVDDSDAVLAYERAALSSHYAIRTASDGLQALAEIKAHRPAVVLLDLSMPVMDGDAVLARMKADPAFAKIPVVIVSSELERGRACLAAGAVAFAPKPVRADELLALVSRVHDEATASARKERLSALFVRVGGLHVGLPIDRIHTVFLQPAARSLRGPGGLSIEVVDLRGEPVCVFDLAERLGVVHAEPLADRKIVVLERPAIKVGFCVDHVHDPEDIEPADVTPVAEWRGSELLPAREAVTAVVTTARGPCAFVDPDALLPVEWLDRLPSLVAQAHTAREGA